MDDVLRKGGDVATLVSSWKSVDERRRKLQGELDTLRQHKNAANEKMASFKDKKSAEFAAARDEMKIVSNRIKEGEATLTQLETEADDLRLAIPNAPHESVPNGTSDADNTVLHTWGHKPTFSFKPQTHADLGPKLGILDFDAGAKIAGARFTVLRGAASKLTRGLINYMLDLHTSHGYDEVWPPAIVRRASLRGTGQLPKFEADLFKLDIPTGPDHVADNDLFLSPTAEVQVTNLYADSIFEPGELPKRLTAYSA
ncbi:MAG TPA: hypothetical protein VFV99_03370, partial [Kofleriaceae bacterium]|nr:hypothetical protein [Kofleriaceae bacterium]